MALETVTAKALAAMELPPPVYVVLGLVTEGVTLLAGRPKLGKSWLSLGLAVAVACGGKALGHIDVDEAGVLYCALEDSKRRLKDRLELVCGDSEPPEHLHILTEMPRLDNGGLDALDEFLGQHPDTRLVILDTYAKVEPVKRPDGDDYQSTTTTGAALQRLAFAHHIGLIAVHHTRKAPSADFLDEVLGSTGLTGSADAVMVLQRSRGEADAKLEVTGRDIEEASLALAFDRERCLWNLLGDAERFTLSKERRHILNLLEQSRKPLAPKEIAKALKKQPGAVRYLLHQMVNERQVEAREGLYTVKSPNTANTLTGGQITSQARQK